MYTKPEVKANEFLQNTYSYIDGHKSDIKKFLSEFIRQKSVNEGVVNSCIERRAQEWVSSKFNEYGFNVEIKAVDDNRPNIIGTVKGNKNGRDLLFNGHVDTVPVNDLERWQYDPFAGTIEGDRVYGRGATDDKGGLTAAIWAVKAVKNSGIPLKGNMHVISSCGEESNEGGTVGVYHAIKDAKEYSDPFAIVCEGSDMDVFTVSCSVCFFYMTIWGKPTHVGQKNQTMYPQRYGIGAGSSIGVDAIKKSLPIIEYLYRLDNDWNMRYRDQILGGGGYPTYDKQGVGIFSIIPVKIEGGTYLGSLPGHVKITYSVWFPNYLTKEEVFEEIKKNILAIASTDDWLRENPPEFKFPVLQSWSGFKTDMNHEGIAAVKRAFKKATGKEPVFTGLRAVSDATYISNRGIPVVHFGAGNATNGVHGIDEFADINKVIEAIKIYIAMILEWCELDI